MILPPGVAGAAFTESVDGDVRNDLGARSAVSATLGVPEEWATVHQVHGGWVIRAEDPGDLGEGDALWTTVRALPVAVFTADCFGVVVVASGAVGVAHSGWRGADAGVVGALVSAMTESGHPPERAVIGPGIGDCCFEVGPEVAARFPDQVSTTTWGTLSVDLASAIGLQLGGLAVERVGGCTRHQERFFSYRRDGTERRNAAVGWLV